ncbi:hypothetical protein CCH79_00004751 [Gambusia affinis]|uniref:V-SNARE coiled-coil homology domain-containing protein n=1 Tax=Gambusia affinis TaxID=33528 RepID=A0A315V138_GAMAF|nr:hypothetical protein CCH79_00004751 [Gambusia affinis]
MPEGRTVAELCNLWDVITEENPQCWKLSCEDPHRLLTIKLSQMKHQEITAFLISHIIAELPHLVSSRAVEVSESLFNIPKRKSLMKQSMSHCEKIPRQTLNSLGWEIFRFSILPKGLENVYVQLGMLSENMTNKKPSHVSLTKVKQFQGSSAFVKRSQWTIDQLRQVNGIDSNKDCPEFDLMFDNGLDQWVASSAGEKCTFIQILHHTCQRYCSARKPEFINCQSKLLGEGLDTVIYHCKVYFNRMRKDLGPHRGPPQKQGNSILHSAADSVTSAVQKASQALNERGERLGRAEERTADMMNSAEQFAVTAHKSESTGCGNSQL